MRFVGVHAEDAPDPRRASADMLKNMPIPVIEFAEQRALEVSDTGVSSGTHGTGYDMMAASVSYTLWRKPDDKSDPTNLAELDDEARRAIGEVPPWPRPPWVVELVERMRYPRLWEAVRTSWYREESEFTTVDRLLVDHVNYILMNQFRKELGLTSNDWGPHDFTSTRMVRQGIDIVIDGEIVVGAEIDTDPFVYAVGAKLDNGGTLTAVIPREYLPCIRLAFARRH